MGRLDEGLAQSRKAAELDPLSVGPAHDIAINAMVRGDYEQAAAGFRHAIDIDPNWTWGYIKLARTLAHPEEVQGGPRPGRDRREENRGRRRAAVVVVARRHLRDVRRDGARPPEARRASRAGKKAVRRPGDVRRRAQRLGEMDEALRWYEKAYEDRTPNMAYASIMPRIDPALAGNARYEAIVRRMGFPGSRMPP